MARYYQKPNNPIVDLTPKVPIEFYSNLMNQAQQNLNQANVTGAAFMTDIYGQEVIDQAARDRAMELGKAPIEQVLDREFVTPAAMAKAVAQASAATADWRNLNAKQLKEAKREQELRDKWGSNYIGNSVLSQRLYNPETGSWIKPDDIKLVAGNREDLVQALARDNAGRADLKREIEGNWQTILGGKALEKRNKTVTGLTEDERVAEFVNNQAMAKQYLSQMPEFAAAIAASGVDPVEYMTKEIDQWSKQLVRGTTYDSKYLDNPAYDPRGGRLPDTATLIPKSYQEMAEGDGTPVTLTIAQSAELRHTGKAFAEAGYGFDYIENVMTGIMGSGFDAYGKKFMTKNKPIWEVAKAKYPDNPSKAVDYFMDESYKHSINPNNKGTSLLFKSNRWDIPVSHTDNGVQRNLIQGNPWLEVKSKNGNKAKLGQLADKNALPTFKDNGDIILSTTDDSYIWNTSDEKVLNSLNTQSQQIIKNQKYLYNQRWSDTPSEELINTGITDYIPDANGNPSGKVGTVAFQVVPSNTKGANKIYKYYFDGTTDENDELNYYIEEVDFDQITKINALALAKINTFEKPLTTGKVR